ncbi:MAG: TIGR00153 family protein [Rhodothermales bacterium]
MPPTNPFASLFGNNPFASLQKHMTAAIATVDIVPGLFKALADGDVAAVAEAKEAIYAAEEEADQIKNDLRRHLPRSLFLPVDRRDLLEVLDMQDSIADVAQDIAGLLVERRMTIPDGMEEDLTKMVDRCVAVCHQSADIIAELDELLAMGFGGREAAQVEEMVSALNASEEETDKLGVALGRALFDREDSLSPVSVMFWYQLIEWIGDLADYAEKVGNRLRLLIAR